MPTTRNEALLPQNHVVPEPDEGDVTLIGDESNSDASSVVESAAGVPACRVNTRCVASPCC